jgi:hypothetical protein
MDHIDFEWLPDAYAGRGELEIRVNGRPLPEIFREVEAPFTTQPDERAAPGAYRGMHEYGLMKSVLWQFQGRRGSHLWSSPQNKTVLQACGSCGETACWPLMARIKLKRTNVVWNDFEQPHRRGRGRLWDYGDLAFVFGRRQYMESLRPADAAVREWRRAQPGS